MRAVDILGSIVLNQSLKMYFIHIWYSAVFVARSMIQYFLLFYRLIVSDVIISAFRDLKQQMQNRIEKQDSRWLSTV